MRRTPWLLMFVVFAACDPGWGASGSITTLSPGAEVPTPVEGAQVRVECPATQAEAATVTNARGEFNVSEFGFLDDDCEVVVSRVGFKARRFSVEQVCRHRWRLGDRRCNSLEIETLLSRSDSPH